jgi:hypothetical protein
MYHDSFGASLIPYLAEHFQRITFRNRSRAHTDETAFDAFAPSWIESERPDFVIDEFIKRQLVLPLPQEIPESSRRNSE